MKIAIINKSDSTGGAAVVSFRLMEALRRAGVDARMVVVEKLTDSPYVVRAASDFKMKLPFISERLKIYVANGFNCSTLFKIDTASDGLDLLKNPVVKEADVIMLNWVNQGMLSLQGIERLSRAGKKIIWTMHDMWCFTGICHHSGECQRYEHVCEQCPLLKGGLEKNLAKKIQGQKFRLYSRSKIVFVAVSNWLADRGAKSSLFGGKRPTVIPNAFPFGKQIFIPRKRDAETQENREFRILFGAARLDDTVKGLPILIEATKILNDHYPEDAKNMRLVTFGEAKDPGALDGIGIAHTHLGRVSGKRALHEVYEGADAVVSTSLYETLPGTLVEGQAYGCIPVAFSRGGQADIIDHLSTGYLASWDDNLEQAARNIAEGLVWAAKVSGSDAGIRKQMFDSAYARFNEEAVAARYLELIESI
ncbi:MAG: glycosyltransferase [Muribaculaceae bacterium]|nr:glycosyltransferase [Muribaculaceae bacterium]